MTQSMLQRLVYEMNGLKAALPPKQFRAWQGALVASLPRILATRRLEPADRLMKGAISFQTWGAPIELNVSEIDRSLPFDPSSSFGLARELYGRNVYLRPFKPFSAAGQTALDLGGNRGLFSTLALAALDVARVIYVEPDARYEVTARSLTKAPAGSPRLRVVRGFAGARPEGAEAPLLNLDDVLAEESEIAFMKADIEGAEEALFKRDSQWLRKVNRIAMEAHPMHADLDGVVTELRAAGFVVHSSDPVGSSIAPGAASYLYCARDRADFVDSYAASAL